MAKQLVTPNYNIPCVGGWCEGYVEGTVGQATLPTPSNPRTSGVWGNAVSAVNPGETGAWDVNYGGGNHPGESPPSGVRVPVFFRLGSTPAGHVALLLEDGRVASTTQGGYHDRPYIHPNIQDLITMYAKYNNGCTYLGWSEYIGKVRVVEGNTMEKVNISTLRIGHSELEGWDRDKTHSGEYDKLFQDTWGHVTANEFIQAKWDQNGAYRDQLNVMATFYHKYSPIIDELLARPITIVKEVKVEVPIEKIVIKEVNITDKDRTFWDLIKAAFNKLGDK